MNPKSTAPSLLGNPIRSLAASRPLSLERASNVANWGLEERSKPRAKSLLLSGAI